MAELNNASLVIEGAGKLGQGLGALNQHQAANAPVSDFQKAWIEELRNDVASGRKTVDEAKQEYVNRIQGATQGGLGGQPQQPAQPAPQSAPAPAQAAPAQPPPMLARPQAAPVAPPYSPGQNAAPSPVAQQAGGLAGGMMAQHVQRPPQPAAPPPQMAAAPSQQAPQRPSLSNPSAFPEPKTQADLKFFQDTLPQGVSMRNADVAAERARDVAGTNAKARMDAANLRAATQTKIAQMRGNTQMQVAEANNLARAALEEYKQGSMDARQADALAQGVANLNAVLAQRDRMVAATNERHRGTLDAKADLALTEMQRKVVADMRRSATDLLTSGMQMADPHAREQAMALASSIAQEANSFDKMFEATAQTRGVPLEPTKPGQPGARPPPQGAVETERTSVRQGEDGPAPQAGVVGPVGQRPSGVRPTPPPREIRPAAAAQDMDTSVPGSVTGPKVPVAAKKKPITKKKAAPAKGNTTPSGKPYAKKMYAPSTGKTYFVDAAGKVIEAVDGQQ